MGGSKSKRDEEVQKRLITAIVGGTTVAAVFLFIVYVSQSGGIEAGAENDLVQWGAELESEEQVPRAPEYIPINRSNAASVITEQVEQMETIINLEDQVGSALGELVDNNMYTTQPRKHYWSKKKAEPELLLSKESWEMVDHMKKQAKLEQKAKHKEASMKKKFYHDGKWYWGKRGLTLDNMCFYNGTTRAADFWTPLPGRWVMHKQALPIYFAFDCWSIKFRPDVLQTKYNCGLERSQSCQRMQFQPSDCDLMPLYDEELLRMWAGRKFWFFGDYHSFQQYEALKCTLYRFKLKEGKLQKKKGSTKGMRTIFQNNIELNFIYAGLHEEAPKTTIELQEHPIAQGLTEEFMREHNLTRPQYEWANQEGKAFGKDVGMFSLHDTIKEYLHDMEPWDIMVANIGNDFSEPRVYQRHMLDFLKLYESAKEDMPVLIWRETPAQHHDNTKFVGGDYASPILRDYIAPPPPNAPAPPLEVVKDKHGKKAKKQPRVHPDKPDWLVKAEQVQCVPISFEEHKEHNWRNELANRLIEAAGIPIIRIWEASTKRYDWYTHACRSPHCEAFGPCMHYCNPGVTTSWNEILRTMLLSPVLRDPLNARLPRPPPPPMTPNSPQSPPSGHVHEELIAIQNMDSSPVTEGEQDDASIAVETSSEEAAPEEEEPASEEEVAASEGTEDAAEVSEESGEVGPPARHRRLR